MNGTTKRRRPGSGISRADVKVCELCGSLNLRANTECFTCGWAGAFAGDVDSVDAAWRGLEANCGPVQRGHVSGGRPPVLQGVEIAGGVGACAPLPPLPPRARVKAWWKSVWG